MSLRCHPLALLRERLTRERILQCARLAETPDGSRVSVCGLVLVRQRPGTASGVVFITLEDETGIANIIVWSSMFERFRRAAMGARLLRVDGKMQREGLVIHIVAERLTDLSARLDALADDKTGSAIDVPTGRGDESRHGSPDRRPPDPRPPHPQTPSRRIDPRSRDFH